MFEQVLDAVTPKYEGKINMYKVNIEEEPEIAQLFGARSIPYMVFINKGGDLSSEAGSMNTDQLKYRFDGLTIK